MFPATFEAVDRSSQRCGVFSAALLGGLLAVSTAIAQGPPGGFDPSRFFDAMDRNQNGRLDPEEIENSRGPIRSQLEGAGIDWRRGVSRDEFSRVISQQSFSRSRSGGEGRSFGGDRGGFGGDRGGFGGDRGGFGGDRGSFGGSRSSFGPSSGDQPREFNGSGANFSPRSDGGPSRTMSSTTTASTPTPSASGTAPVVPVRVTIDLQRDFAAGDTDSDGQIGFYEWLRWKGRAEIAKFSELDINGDGFLTPREILNQSNTGSPTLIAATGTPSPLPSSAPPPSSAVTTPAAAPSAATPVPAPATPVSTTTPEASPIKALTLDISLPIDENDSSVRRYRNSFRLLDRNSDGRLSLDEWERSTNIRKKFADAGVDLRQPMDGDTFVRFHLTIDSRDS